MDRAHGTSGGEHGQLPAPTFGATVRRLRHARGMSQAALAEAAGVSPAYIGLLETGQRGQRISLDFTVRIALGLGLQMGTRRYGVESRAVV